MRKFDQKKREKEKEREKMAYHCELNIFNGFSMKSIDSLSLFLSFQC